VSEQTFRTTGGFTVDEHLDLRACDTAPIHRADTIQPHGTFLELDPGDGRIRAAADNFRAIVEGAPEEVLDRASEDVLGGETASRVTRWRGAGCRGTQRFLLAAAGGARLMHLFPAGDRGGVEIEAVPEADGSERILLDLVPRLERLRGAAYGEELFGAAVRSVRDVTGFDRVMLYRFDPDGHGSVAAEARRDDIPSFLHHHFPGSDIPDTARRLYRQTGIRSIPDVDYEPVLIRRPPRAGDEPAPDLTHADLRAVPEVHRQYLRNMGVGSSLSVSLVVGGRLWGLIACHGSGPHHLHWTQRRACELAGQFLSHEIARANAEKEERRRRVLETLEEQVGSPESREDLAAELEAARQGLVSVLDASAFYLQWNGDAVWLPADPDAGPDAPPPGLPELISRSLQGRRSADVRSIAGELEEDWPHSTLASGFRALRLGRSPRQYGAWIRPEMPERIDWGGDPRRPAVPGTDGGLNPRDSFETWTQLVVGRCAPWTELDRRMSRRAIQLVDELYIDVQFHRLARMNDELELRNRQLEEARREREVAHARRKELLAQMEELARTDSLTGLANRRALRDRLEEEVERIGRYGGRLAVAIVDLDRFKEVNDRYGHHTGDRVLARYGEILDAQTRESDLVGRHGGEEFAVVLPETGLAEAEAMGRRILEAGRGAVFESGDGEDAGTFQVTCSIGIAELTDPEAGADDVYRRADAALYRAKETGRDRVVTDG